MYRNKGLCVVDHPYWISATIAHAIRRSCHDTEIDVVSIESMLEHQEMLKKISGAVDFVHFLTPHLFPRVSSLFPDDVARVTHVHHLEDDRHDCTIAETDLIITGSKQWENALRTKHVADDKMIRIPYGVDLSIFTPQTPERKAHSRARFGIKPNIRVIGLVAKKSSNTSSRKGIDTFTRLLRDLGIQRKDVGVFFLGFGWDEEVSTIRRLGIEVYHEAFLPTVLDLAGYYHALDVLCVTARIEGGPVPVFEAMACGIPIVSTPVGMVLDWVRHGENGMICDFEDTQSMIEAICSLLDDHSSYDKVGKKARETVAAHLTWECVTKRADAIYSLAVARAVARSAGAPHEARKEKLAKAYQTFLSRVRFNDQMLLAEHLKSTGNIKAAKVLENQMLRNFEFYRRYYVSVSTNVKKNARQPLGRFRRLIR